MPARALAHGALIAFAAVLMIIPGFITDIFGMALFVPAVRAALWRRLGKNIVVRRGRAASASYRGRVATVDLGRHEYSASERRDSPWLRDEGRDS
jgi:UPF0716 protein FxsA